MLEDAWWYREEQAQRAAQTQADAHVDPNQSEAKQIDCWAKGILAADAGCRCGAHTSIKQVMGHRITPEQVKEDSNRHINTIVENRGGFLSWTAQVLSQNFCWKRDYGDSEQQKKVEHQQDVIRFADVGEHAVMVDPHNARKRKAQEESKVRRPLAQQRSRERAVIRVRNLYLKNEQSDGNGKDAI